MILHITEWIYWTSLSIAIWDVSLLHELDDSIDITNPWLWTCLVEWWKWTIRIKNMDLDDLDHELSHFMEWIMEYLWMQPNWRSETLTYLRWYYLNQILRNTPKKHILARVERTYDRYRKENKDNRKRLKGVP